MKTILEPKDFQVLNQIDPYTLYDYLSTKMVMFGGIKPEDVEDRDLGITEYQVRKYLFNINNLAMEDFGLRHAENIFLQEVFEEELNEEELEIDDDLPF